MLALPVARNKADTRVLHAFVRRLRRRLGDDAHSPRDIFPSRASATACPGPTAAEALSLRDRLGPARHPSPSGCSGGSSSRPCRSGEIPHLLADFIRASQLGRGIQLDFRVFLYSDRMSSLMWQRRLCFVTHPVAWARNPKETPMRVQRSKGRA